MCIAKPTNHSNHHSSRHYRGGEGEGKENRVDELDQSFIFNFTAPLGNLVGALPAAFERGGRDWEGGKGGGLSG